MLDQAGFTKVYLYDKEPIADKPFPYRIQQVESEPRIEQVIGDVRQPITWQPDEPVALIANFAAVHREPGHEDIEYYETNLLGAEHVCTWAEQVGCQQVIFTVSASKSTHLPLIELGHFFHNRLQCRIPWQQLLQLLQRVSLSNVRQHMFNVCRWFQVVGLGRFDQ